MKAHVHTAVSRIGICALISFALVGCNATMQTVRVPVPVECQQEMPERPAMPTEAFTTRPKLDEFARSAMAEIERREGYEGKLRTALEACKAPIAP